MTGALRGEHQRCLNIFRLKIGKIGQNLASRDIRREHIENVGYSDTQTANARLAATFAGLGCDAL